MPNEQVISKLLKRDNTVSNTDLKKGLLNNSIRFPWGQIKAMHEIGSYLIVEYVDNGGDIFFKPYVNSRDTGKSFETIEYAIVHGIAYNLEDNSNTQAAKYFMKAVTNDNPSF